MTALTPAQFDYTLSKLACLLRSRKPSEQTRKLINLQTRIATNAIQADIEYANKNPTTRIAGIMLARADQRQAELDKILDR